MSAPSIERTYPKFGDASTVVALISLREAWSQWRLKNGNDLVGSLDKRPLPVTLRPETEEEARKAWATVFPIDPPRTFIMIPGSIILQLDEEGDR